MSNILAPQNDERGLKWYTTSCLDGIGTPSRVAGRNRQYSSAAITFASMAGPRLWTTTLFTMFPASSMVISTTTLPSVPGRSSGSTTGSKVTAGSAARISCPTDAPSDNDPYAVPAEGAGLVAADAISALSCWSAGLCMSRVEGDSPLSAFFQVSRARDFSLGCEWLPEDF